LQPHTVDISLTPLDNTRLANFCGPLDENLRQIETAFDVVITRRSEHCRISGGIDRVRMAAESLTRLYKAANKPLGMDDVQLGVIEVQKGKPSSPSATSPTLLTRKAGLHGRTPNQGLYLRQIQEHDITFGIGPAGTGKTYLAVASAVDAYERDQVQRIILTRPAVEAGERLGFLPGDLTQKVDPYLRPLYDALYDLMGHDKVGRMFEKGNIEIAPLAYMRGRTLNNAFIILDEAQNTTPEQIKMFLTRIGFGAKAVITGDPTQVDLPRGAKSGLVEARRILQDVRGLAFTDFVAADVVRHPLVARIVEAYESDAKKQARESRNAAVNAGFAHDVVTSAVDVSAAAEIVAASEAILPKAARALASKPKASLLSKVSKKTDANKPDTPDAPAKPVKATKPKKSSKE
jgi:phosphate starvation-inducible PhoH-like protein